MLPRQIQPRQKTRKQFPVCSSIGIRSGAVLLLLGLAILVGAISPSKAQSPPHAILDNSTDSIDLWSYLTLLSDPHNALTLSDVLEKKDQFKVPDSPYANLGLRQGTVWLSTDIELPNDAPLNWWLSIDFVHLDEIDLYVLDRDQVLQRLSFRERQAFALAHSAFHQPAFRLTLKPGRHYTLMIRVRKYVNSAMLMPISLERTGSMVRKEASTQFWLSLAFGFETSFAIYAFFIAVLYRDRLCVWFALFVAGNALYQFTYFGLANEYVWPNSSVPDANIVARFLLLFNGTACLMFIDGVLDLRQQSPRVSILLRVLAASFALSALFLAAGFVSLNFVAMELALLDWWPLAFLIPLAVRRIRTRDSLLNWALVGAACLTLGQTTGAALFRGALPWSRWVEYSEPIGEFLDMAAWIVVLSIWGHRKQQAAEAAAKREQKIAEHERYVAQLLAADLQRQKEIVEEISLEKSRFLAAASHDLRQPVHAISLFVGALSAVPMPSEGRHLVERIEASTNAMDRLFAALLDISKLDAGVVEVNPQPFAISVVLNRICIDYASEASAKGLTISHVPCRAIVDSDPTLVERIMRNLISNAVRYTDTGKIVVGCRYRGARIAVQICDTGRGIPPDQQNIVFQEYYQANNPERDREKGLGLGLAIVRRLTTLLECNLRLRSQAGRGSCFEVSLARVERAAMPLEAPAADGPHAPVTGLIVVIDDEGAIRMGTATLLGQWGYEVLAASSADEAIQLLATHTERPALLVCDLRLRDGESGIDAIERLRTEYNESIPAMLITGDTAASRLLEVHASEVLVLHKPIPSVKLREAISTLIANERA